MFDRFLIVVKRIRVEGGLSSDVGNFTLGHKRQIKEPSNGVKDDKLDGLV